MIDERNEIPSPDDTRLVRRVDRLPPDAHRWIGNGARTQADHHGLVNAASGPCYIRLEWTDERGARVAHVGDYRLDLRALAKDGYVQDKGKSVRLRFVRWVNGLVIIQANDSGPWLAVGWAQFE